MSTEALKSSINQLIEKENDEAVLMAIKEVVKSIVSIKKKQIVGFGVDGEPITGEQLSKKVLAASENAAKGNVLSHDDLLMQMKSW
jgi:hypothetical protein